MDKHNSSTSVQRLSNDLAQTYTILDNKRFRCMSRDLMMLLVEKLGGSALKVYLALYDRAEFIRHQKSKPEPIYISYAALAKATCKSTSTIGRALNELKTKGFIKIFDQGKSNDVYLPTKILVGLPKRIASNILNTIPDRKDSNGTKDFSSIEKDTLCSSENYPELSQEQDDLLSEYNNRLDKFKADGFKVAEAGTKAMNSFSAEDQLKICSYNLPESQYSVLPASPKLVERKSKSEQQKDNNRKDLMLTKDSVVKADPLPEKNQSKKFVNKKYFSKDEIETIEKKIRYMKNSRLIAGDANYKSLSEVLAEIRFHISHSPLTFKHALNASCKLLREGLWQKPKKMVFFESCQREKQAQKHKEEELSDFRKAWGNEPFSAMLTTA